jgi:ABC-type Na+ efflux pump permease subunit
MNWRAIRAIMRKDLKVVLQSKAVVWPMILVPVLLLIVIPGAMGYATLNVDISDPQLSDLAVLLEQMPASLLDEFGPLPTDSARLFLYVVVYAFAPLFLIVPLMVANVIAADSFVGEKERKTLEALLYTPTTDQELYVAKLLSPWAAALVTTLVGMVAYTLVVNAIGWPALGRIFFPNLTWIVLVVWVAPAAAGLGLGAMVLVSSRTRTFQEAYQVGGVVVLPVIAVLIGQFAGIITFDLGFALVMGLVLWLIVAAMLWYGIRSFQRVSLLAQL